MVEDKITDDDKATEKQQKKSGLLKWYFWSFGFVLLSVLGYLGFLMYVSWPISTYSIDKSALLGDSFGILSSLFSGLAFAGLIVTLVMQRKTLDAQMEELELARKEYKRQGDELAGQKDVMAAQFDAIQLQQFESTFFRLLDEFRLFKATDKYHFGSDTPYKLSTKFNLEINWSDDSTLKKSMDYDRHIWLSYISKISVIIRFTYHGYMKDVKNKARTYTELLHNELTQEELFWLILALSYFGSDEDLGLFQEAKILKKFDLRSSFFSVLFDGTVNFQTEKSLNVLANLKEELFDRSDYLAAFEAMQSSVTLAINNQLKTSDELDKEVAVLSERIESLISIAKERFNFSDKKLAELLALNLGSTIKNYDDLKNLEEIVTAVELRSQYAMTKNLLAQVSRSVEKNASSYHRLIDMLNVLNEKLS